MPDRDGEARQVAFLESVGDHPVMSRFAVKYHGVREVLPLNIRNVARGFPVHDGQHKRQSLFQETLRREPPSTSNAEEKLVQGAVPSDVPVPPHGHIAFEKRGKQGASLRKGGL